MKKIKLSVLASDLVVLRFNPAVEVQLSVHVFLQDRNFSPAHSTCYTTIIVSSKIAQYISFV